MNGTAGAAETAGAATLARALDQGTRKQGVTTKLPDGADLHVWRLRAGEYRLLTWQEDRLQEHCYVHGRPELTASLERRGISPDAAVWTRLPSSL